MRKMRRFKVTIIIAVPLVVAIALLWANLQPFHHPGYHDDSPWGDPWGFLARTQYGWPFEFVFVFDDPNAWGRPWHIDPFALGLSSVVWLFLLGVTSLPLAVVLWRDVIQPRRDEAFDRRNKQKVARRYTGRT